MWRAPVPFLVLAALPSGLPLDDGDLLQGGLGLVQVNGADGVRDGALLQPMSCASGLGVSVSLQTLRKAFGFDLCYCQRDFRAAGLHG